jgi:glucose/mannose-6-phosphate isomerase
VAATRLRGQLNENSKSLASSHLFPEMNHNEIVGWQNPKRLFKNFIVLMLRDKQMYPRVAKRMDITENILKKEDVAAVEIWSHGKDLLSRIFSLIYIGDFISYYLAILYGVDPTPVDKVTYLKKRLAEVD